MPLRRTLALPFAVPVLSLTAALTGCTGDSDESVEPPRDGDLGRGARTHGHANRDGCAEP